MVNSAPGFVQQPAVINGFGPHPRTLGVEAGAHARSAVGMAELPFGMPVEIEGEVEIVWFEPPARLQDFVANQMTWRAPLRLVVARTAPPRPR